MLLCGCGSTSVDDYIYCWKCGKKISSDSAYCSYCGTEINRQSSKKEENTQPAGTARTEPEKNTAQQETYEVTNQGIAATSYKLDENNPFTWQNIKQYYACGYENSEYVIALDKSGGMHMWCQSSDSEDDALVREIRELENIRQFYPLYNCYSLIVAAVGNDGSVSMHCNDEYYDELCREAEEFRNVSSVAFGCDDCGGALSMCLLLEDGTVRSTNAGIDCQVDSWKNISKIYGMYNECYLGIKTDGSCVGFGVYFGEDAYMYNSAQMNISSLDNIASAYYYMAPWGLNMFFMKKDGSLLCNWNCDDNHVMKNTPVLYDIESLNHDTCSGYSLYILNSYGLSGEFMPMECTVTGWAESDVKSVGVDGLCVKEDGSIVSGRMEAGKFKYTILNGFEETDTDNGAAIESINYAASKSNHDGRYWAITEDGSLRLIKTNQAD